MTTPAERKELLDAEAARLLRALESDDEATARRATVGLLILALDAFMRFADALERAHPTG